MFEELHAQIEKHALNRIVREVVAGVEEERADPVEEDHAAEQDEEQAQIRPSERFVDDDFEYQRHEQSETRAADMKHDADIEHSLIRFDELVQLFKMRQVFVFHGWGNSGLGLGFQRVY